MTSLLVVDTNVVVSGVLAGAGESPNARILDAMMGGRLRFVLSEALLAEYRQVLLRPAIAGRHGLTESEVDALLEELILGAVFCEPPAECRAPAAEELDPRPADVDPPAPGDEHIVALLSVVPRAVLVTGDRRLREAVAPGRAVLTPAECAASLA